MIKQITPRSLISVLCLLSSLSLFLFPDRAEALFGRSKLGAIETYPTELELATETISSSLLRCFADIPLGAGDNVGLKEITENKDNWLIKDCLTKLLLEKGCHVARFEGGEEDSLNQESLPPDLKYIISYRITGLRLEYRRSRKLIFRDKFIRRRVQTNCLFNLINNHDGTIIWSSWMRAEKADSIPSKYKDLLKSDTFSERTTIEKESKWVEALVVVGVVGSMLYILF